MSGDEKRKPLNISQDTTPHKPFDLIPHLTKVCDNVILCDDVRFFTEVVYPEKFAKSKPMRRFFV
jgi:hypothetical protein